MSSNINLLIWLAFGVFVAVWIFGFYKGVRQWRENGSKRAITDTSGRSYESNPIINSPTYSSVSGNIHHR